MATTASDGGAEAGRTAGGVDAQAAARPAAAQATISRKRRSTGDQAEAARLASIASHIRAAASTPEKRFSCWAPVGEVTLISVR